MEQVMTKGGQFLTFTLAEEQYAVEVIHVREVLSDLPVTAIPRMPDFMKGIINIRGSVVPVVDLRTKFGMEQCTKTDDTSIIVMDIHTDQPTGDITVGCLADSVQEVVEISTEMIQPPPSLGTSVDVGFINGIAKKDDHFIILLDIDEVFRSTEFAL